MSGPFCQILPTIFFKIIQNLICYCNNAIHSSCNTIDCEELVFFFQILRDTGSNSAWLVQEKAPVRDGPKQFLRVEGGGLANFSEQEFYLYKIFFFSACSNISFKRIFSCFTVKDLFL